MIIIPMLSSHPNINRYTHYIIITSGTLTKHKGMIQKIQTQTENTITSKEN